jgi:hypothetical protein
VVGDPLGGQLAMVFGDPDTKAQLANVAMQTVGNAPEAFAAFLQKDIAKAVTAAANVTVE